MRISRCGSRIKQKTDKFVEKHLPQISSTKIHSEKIFFRRRVKGEVSLVLLNVMKFQKSYKTLQGFHQSLGTLKLAEMTLNHLWKNALKKKKFRLNLENCYYQVSFGTMEHS